MRSSLPRVLIATITALIFLGCNSSAPKAPHAVPYPEWVRNSIIYETNVRQYSPEGTFKALQKDLPRIKDLGIDILWLMPIYPIGIKDRKVPAGATTSLGSYYSIRDYKAINPEFGNGEDFKQLVNKAHAMGIKIMIDWVANHTSRDNSWITDHPGWYKKDKNGTIATPFDWTDCAQLDYTNQAMRQTMVEAMKFWIINYDIDGFRCDMAGLVPTDFWEEARTELQKIKLIYFLAENEDKPELGKYAFDSNYGWEMHHLMADVTQGKKKVTEILRLQAKVDSTMPSRAFKLNFITNHDENSWNGTAKEKFGNGEEGCAVLTFTLPGMPLVYNGQEVSLTKRLSFFTKDTIDWSNKDKYAFYKTLISLKHRNEAIWNPPYGGTIQPVATTAPEKLIAFVRSKGKAQVFVLINLSADPVSATINGTTADGTYVNIFNKNKIILDADNRDCYLEPWGYLVLEGTGR
jgi:glycosidase